MWFFVVVMVVKKQVVTAFLSSVASTSMFLLAECRILV